MSNIKLIITTEDKSIYEADICTEYYDVVGAEQERVVDTVLLHRTVKTTNGVYIPTNKIQTITVIE